MPADTTSLDAGEEAKPVFAPTPEWLAELTKQLTDELYAKATRYATLRAQMVLKAGADIDVDDLVEDAIADTLDGTLVWDPAKCPLWFQVKFAIRSRTRHAYVRAVHKERVSLHPHEASRVRSAAETALAARDEEDRHARELATELIEALRLLAHGDRDAQLLLDAYDAQSFTPQEVMATTKMSTKRLRNARLRLARYRQRLPAELQRTARPRARGTKS
jgi:hypothetical protein